MARRVIYEAVFWGLVIVYAAPLWVYRFVPSEDGPAHLGNAFIIKEYHRPAGDLYRRYFVLNWRLATNVGYHYALAGAMNFFPPLIAEKILLTLYVVGFATGVRFLTRLSGAPAGVPPVFLAFPFIYSFPFQLGFYGWALSVMGAFWGLGYYLRRGAPPRDWLVLNALGIVIYLFHIVGDAVYWGGVMIMAAAGAVSGSPSGVGGKLKLAARAALAAGIRLPVVPALIIYYWVTVRARPDVTRWPATRVLKLFAGEILWGIGKVQLRVGMAVIIWLGVLVVVALAAAARRPAWPAGSAAWGWAALLTAAAAFILPDGAPAVGNYLTCRLVAVSFVFGAVWLASRPEQWLRKILFITTPVAAAGFAVTVFTGYAAANARLATFISGVRFVPRDAVILTVTNLFGEEGDKVNYAKHGGGYYVCSRHVVDLNNYQPAFAYFPVRWRAGKPPVRILRYNNLVPVYEPARVYEYAAFLVRWRAPARPGRITRLYARYEEVFTNGPLVIARRLPAAMPNGLPKKLGPGRGPYHPEAGPRPGR